MTGLRATEEIELLAGELFAEVAHAARGSGRVCVRLRETAGRVRVEIAHEPVPDAPALAAHDPLEVAILERLLDAFAARWGRTVSSAHNATWFEYVLTVRLPDTGDPACYQGPSEESAK
jgi:hypothetical protein